MLNQIEKELYNNFIGLGLYEKENYHRNLGQEILGTMTNSDIMEIITDKRKELKLYPDKYEWYQDSNNTDTLKLVINRLNFEIRQRNPETKTTNTKELLDKKKREVPILLVIQSITGKHIDHSLSRNIRCMLPGHNDKTSSLHIYQHTNTFKCFGCGKGGSQVDFIKEMHQCDISTAIKLFLTM